MIRLICAALFFLGGLVPAMAAAPDEATLAYIGSAHTVRVVVDQQYHHTGHSRAATGPKTMPDFRLPFQIVAADLLHLAGVRVVGPDATQYDATLTISARGRAIGNFYFDGPEGYLFTGAELSGEIVFTAPGLLAWQTQFAGRHLPPVFLSLNLGYENPANAPLLKIFNAPTSYVARMMTVIAAAYGAAPLIAALDRDTPTDRVFAARALGELRDTAATDALTALLADHDPALRREAAWSLGRIGDSHAAPALTAALEDSNHDVRWFAKWALEQIGGDVP